jgi:hypothetical protein
MLSLPPCTVPVDIYFYTKIGSRLPLRNAGIGAESDDVRRVQKMGPNRRVIQNANGEASYCTEFMVGRFVKGIEMHTQR